MKRISFKINNILLKNRNKMNNLVWKNINYVTFWMDCLKKIIEKDDNLIKYNIGEKIRLKSRNERK